MRRTRAAPPASAWRLRDDALEAALLSGERAQLLEAYFGEARYAELRALAQAASRRSVRGGPRVLLLPGLMGSKLGIPGTLFDDVIWIDPIDAVIGRLDALALGEGPTRIEALGVLLLVYLKLQLTLRIAGFDASFHPFDWRLGVAPLGRALAARVRREERPLQIVAHSMGGLVARAALKSDPAAMRRVERLVMLGTPNHGSFMPVQALRGTHDLVRKLALFDLAHDAEHFASQVLHTLPSAYQLLPAPESFSAVDLYRLAGWPTQGLRPPEERLREGRRTQALLAPADERCFLIAGVNQPTVTSLSLPPDGREFEYVSTLDGDGTVPLALARLEGVPTWYVEESHGSLPNHGAVGRAVCDLLDHGRTEALPDRWERIRRRGRPSTRRDSELRAPAFEGRALRDLRQDEIRSLLAEVASPLSSEGAALPPQGLGAEAAGAAGEGAALAGAAPAAAPSRTGLVVGRRRQRRLDVSLALGSLTEADAAAYLVGLFRHVEPGGVASALDARLGGVIRELTQRRMFGGNPGEVFLLPVRRERLPTETIVFTGLGPPEFYDDEVQQLAAEHAMRALLRARIDDCASVLFGSRPGPSTARSLENLLTGFLRALRDADPRGRFRALTLCELDPQKFEEMRAELHRLSATELFADVEVTLGELRLEEDVARPDPTRRLAGGPEPLYLLVREETRTRTALGLRASLLTPGRKATVLSAQREVPRSALDAQLAAIEKSGFTFARLGAFGAALAALVLPPEILDAIAGLGATHVVVVHDEGASRIPWETLRVGERFLAAGAGLSRRYVAQNLSPAKWLEQRVQGDTLELLLVVNPTADLPGAEREGRRLRALFGAHSRVRITALEREQATRKALLAAFRSGGFDAIHYAGHAFFDPLHPARSGILCHRDEVLAGADLASLASLPGLVFFNACESGRLRRRAPARRETRDAHERIARTVGFAEAFLRGGVANYVGTYWPVGDEAAESFAQRFYGGLLEGRAIGEALADARAALRKLESVDWTDYVHFGSYDFRVKAV